MTKENFRIFVVAILSIMMAINLLSVPWYITRLNDRRFQAYVNECYLGNKSSCYLASSMCENTGKQGLMSLQLLQKANEK